MRAVTTSQICAVSTIYRVIVGGLLNDTGFWFFSGDVAFENLTINKNLTDVSVGRNGSCCEKWDDK